MGKTGYKNSFVNWSQVGCCCPKKSLLCGCVTPPPPPVPWKRENSIGRQEQSTPNLTCSHQLSYLLEQGIAVWKRLWVRHLSCSSALARGVSAPLLHPACSPSPGRTGGYCWGSSAGLLLRMHICSGSSMVISTSTHQ